MAMLLQRRRYSMNVSTRIQLQVYFCMQWRVLRSENNFNEISKQFHSVFDRNKYKSSFIYLTYFSESRNIGIKSFRCFKNVTKLILFLSNMKIEIISGYFKESCRFGYVSINQNTFFERFRICECASCK